MEREQAKGIYLRLNFHCQQMERMLPLYHIAKRTVGRVGKQTEITRFISHRQQKIKKTTQKILNREAIQERANQEAEVAKTRNREMRTRTYWILESM